MLCLIGCGKDPKVDISRGDDAEVPAPANLGTVITRDIQPKILSCYKDIGDDESGTVIVSARGSHGIVKFEVGLGAPDALSGCVMDVLGNARLQRSIADGPTEVGFILAINFSPG